MYAEIAWVLVSSGTQVQPQVILDPDYFPDYLSVSYDYDGNDCFWTFKVGLSCLISSTSANFLLNLLFL